MLSALCLFISVAASDQDKFLIPDHHEYVGAVKLDSNYELAVTARLVDTHITSHSGPVFDCDNRCRGGVHVSHKLCDMSCDTPCSAVHTATIEYKCHVLEKPSKPGDQLSAGLRAIGSSMDRGDVIYRIFNKVSESVLPHKEKLDLRIHKEHFNPKPCSSVKLAATFHWFQIEVDWSLRRVNVMNGGAQFGAGLKGTTLVASFGVPQPEMITFSETDQCACTIFDEQFSKVFEESILGNQGFLVALDKAENDAPPIPKVSAPLFVTPRDRWAISEPGLKNLKFEAVCQNMNEGQLVCTNPFMTDLTVAINPGCILDTDESNEQDMVVYKPFATLIMPRWNLAGPLVPEPQDTSVLRLLCLEMEKREPEPTAKYRVLPTYNPILAALVSLPSPRFGGSPFQARVWVYTEGATFDQISKKLVTPKLTPSDYLLCVHDVHLAGADLGEPKYARCFDPMFLNFTTLRRTALNWYADELLRRDSKGFVKWAGDSANFSAAIVTDQRGETYTYIARLLSHLAVSDSADAQKSALLLLRSAVPESARVRLAAEPLGAVRALIFSRHLEVAALAAEVIPLLK